MNRQAIELHHARQHVENLVRETWRYLCQEALRLFPVHGDPRGWPHWQQWDEQTQRQVGAVYDAWQGDPERIARGDMPPDLLAAEVDAAIEARLAKARQHH